MSERTPEVPEGTRTTVAVQWPVYQRLASLRRTVAFREHRDNMTLSDAIGWALDQLDAKEAAK